MPRVSFEQQFKSTDTERFPKFKLTLGEKARLWIPKEEKPWMEWYHRIEAPMVENGEPVTEARKRGDGTPYETWKMDWIGNVFCLGDTGTPEHPGPMITEGIDPANCPACESAAKNTGVAGPKQRFAINVIKYKIRGRGPTPYELASPTSAEVLIWAYTDRRHGDLHELGQEHGDLRMHDLKIELEDSPGADTFQKIKTFGIIVKPAYTDPKVREYVTDLWQRHPENRATDEQLRDACLGRDVPRLVLMDMVRRAERQYQQVEQAGTGGGDTAAADSAFNGDVASGVDALLDTDHQGGAPVSGPWADEDPNPKSYPLPGHADEAGTGGGLDEFMSAADKQSHFAAIEEAKQQAQRDLAAGAEEEMQERQDPDDPFADETSPATGATTTGTAAPAAARPSSTAPKSAEPAGTSDRVREAIREGEEAIAGGGPLTTLDDVVPEPPKANGRKKAKAAEQPSLTPEPAKAAAGGEVYDFDQLFSD